MTIPAPHDTPAVTVVLIVHNDAKRLPKAVRSVLRQTLRSLELVIVDDGSSDDTPAVITRLAASEPRIRAVHHAVNSGGCGKPRNTGLAHARAPYVMFLDSDDRLERHACKNLLEALEDSGADFAMGRVRRLNVGTGATWWWVPELFEQRRLVAGLADDPRLLDDVLTVNKLFRLSFLDEHGIRFPEDVHYEDQLVSLQAYHRATRIAVIPELVYHWCVYDTGPRRSITQSRQSATNFLDRITVHRRMDAYIAAHGTPELQRLKDLKFLGTDMRLYLNDVLLEEATTARVVELAQDYLRGIPAERFAELPGSLRACYAMALRRDLEGLRQAVLWDRRGVLALAAERVGDEVRVGRVDEAGPQVDPRWAPSDPENALLVVEPDVLRMPVATYHLHHEVTEVVTTRRGTLLRGRTTDSLGKLAAAGDDWSLRLRLRRDGPVGTHLHAPVRVTPGSTSTLHWEATLPLRRITAGPERSTWVVSMHTRVGAHARTSPLVWPEHLGRQPLIPPPSVALRFRTAVIVPTQIGSPRVEVGGDRALPRRVLRKAMSLAGRPSRPGPSAPAPGWADWERVPWRAKAYAAMRRLPLDDHLVVFEAQLGTVYGDSPKYVYEELRRSHPEMAAVWVLPEGHEPPHAGVTVVHRGSAEYLLALARARYWVDDQTFPAYVRKRQGQRYLQTWHGIPLKRMGRDVASTKLPQQKRDRGIGAWDELVVPSPYFEDVFVSAFAYRKGLVRYGTPRNDPLVDGSLTTAEARRLLDLPAAVRIVLYAPTFRDRSARGRTGFELPFDLVELLAALPDDTYVLLRPHYLNRVEIPRAGRFRVVDVSRVDDVNLLYLAADVLVTDYSSVMFDYAHLGRPIVLHTPDLDEYLSARGTYLDLCAVAPGPMTTTTEQLCDAVVSALRDPQAGAERRARFVEDYCGREDGNASARAVAAMLGPDGAP